jgi:hypothetical protein
MRNLLHFIVMQFYQATLELLILFPKKLTTAKKASSLNNKARQYETAFIIAGTHGSAK